MARAKALSRTFLIAAIAILSACSRPEKIVVGSKNFTEQLVLGEIMAQQIERTVGVRVDRRLNLGGTMLAQQALISGAIDLYPEYTGTALTAILKQPLQSDPGKVLDLVRRTYADRFQLTWLEPFGFNNTFAMVIRRSDAGTVRTITEAASARSWKLGVGYEFLQRPDGFPGLARTYGLRTDGGPVTMDLGLLFTALRNGQVNMVAANSTDGVLAVIDAVVLRDDRAYFPPYECAPVVRKETLERYPKLQPALQKLSGSLTDETMRRLNYAVDGEHKPIREVAAQFLATLKD
ncbi:MAG: ABC transporter substrate-binding protein [Bryobacteraceae bacterium]|nr:ABC transporter substrate-binding protein [Bryobacteraceae bacterium]